MNRTISVAAREFLATVMSKGFVIAVVLVPLVVAIAVGVTPLLLRREGPAAHGKIAVIDRSGLVGDRIARAFSAEALKQRRAEDVDAEAAKSAEALKQTGVADPSSPVGKAASRLAAAQRVGAAPDFKIELLSPDADMEKASRAIVSESKDPSPTVALVVIEKAAITGLPDGSYLGYGMLVAPRLDFQVQERIEREINRCIVDARIDASGMGDQKAKIRALVDRPQVNTRAVTAEGIKAAGGAGAGMLMPMAFMMLLWVSVFTAGQYLLTTTIEEKASRVMEVLLSAVSPMQLMTGKIIGQMAVGLLILTVYTGLGVVMLISNDLTHLIEWSNVALLVVYFLIAFFLIASLMAAIGSAVSDMREAQSLMGPIMMVLMLPMILWMPIQRDPNSTLATALSFVPPIGPFVMVLRISGSEPVPAWQVPATIAAGIAYSFVFAWAAAKVFRIGVLMYGKPPNFATLIKWIRMA